MNVTKKREAKWIVGLVIAMLIGLASATISYGMEIEPAKPSNLPVQVYFSPQDQDKIMKELSALLDNAKKQVFVAMYWLTDPFVIEKIIAVKKRGVDVQIIIDESISKFFDLDNLINQFEQNNIIPVVYPSKNVVGIMHNKCVIVDGTTVLTGSANFTKQALDSSAWGFNFENVLIINSADIATKFKANFVDMKQMIIEAYVEIISLGSLNELPEWMSRLLLLMYKNQPLMQQSVQEAIVKHNPEEQKIINSFFGIQPKPATEQQLKGLRSKGLQGLTDLSYTEAIYLLRNPTEPNLKRKFVAEKQPLQAEVVTKKRAKMNELATEPQLRLLREMGFFNNEMAGLSKQDASNWISRLKEEGSFVKFVPATNAQLNMLMRLGMSDYEIEDLSKQEASDLISQLKDEQGQESYGW